MKELSIEDKARRYDEALKKAKNYYSPETVCNVRIAMENLFPELKESEDERIRKDLIKFIKGCGAYSQEYVDWLEKLGDIDNKFIRMRETKPKDISEFLDRLTTVEQEFLWEHIAKIRELDKEEQCEQGPIDKVGPKFKVGDWVVNTVGDTNQIVKVLDDGYTLDDSTFISNYWTTEHYHLWTIKDAKDGDVLVYVTDEEDLWIMIYWSLYEPYEGHVHYHALLVNNNFSDKGTCCISIDNLKPATKEQRDLLFQKMKEAGYEGDAEKKELKKIERNLAWSEEDEKTIHLVCEFITHHSNHNDSIGGIDCSTLIERLKFLKDRYTWKPSEAQMVVLNDIIINGHLSNANERILKGLQEQLKKLREK